MVYNVDLVVQVPARAVPTLPEVGALIVHLPSRWPGAGVQPQHPPDDALEGLGVPSDGALGVEKYNLTLNP